MTKNNSIGVMHLVDSLAMGGTERVAVNLANRISSEHFDAYLCTTRQGGPLERLVAPTVKRLALNRKRTLDTRAIRTASEFIRAYNIRILHAHATSLFFARLVGLLCGIPVIWHDHYGRCELNDRPLWPYRIAVRDIAAVIAVNELLADWSHKNLWVPVSRIRYVPNLIDFSDHGVSNVELPGQPGKRIICVANLRPQKDHLTLLRAMARVIKDAPAAHLLLAGDCGNRARLDELRDSISQLKLNDNVTYLGPRQDVPAILRACDMGVLSSISEGLPLSLLEYGAAGLPVVVTDVGQCSEVVDKGRGGILVEASNPRQLAEGILALLSSTELRHNFGERLRNRVLCAYSPGPIIKQISDIYKNVLNYQSGPLKIGSNGSRIPA